MLVGGGTHSRLAAAETEIGEGEFFFGRTFDLVSGEKCFCACAV